MENPYGGGVEMKKGEKVQLVGFGTFEVAERAARTGRNPQTGEEVKKAIEAVEKDNRTFHEIFFSYVKENVWFIKLTANLPPVLMTVRSRRFSTFR